MRQQFSIFVFSICALIFLTKMVVGDIIGRVSHVEDGDTIDICVPNTCVTVRICGINAPEKGETGYFQAKQALIKLPMSERFIALGSEMVAFAMADQVDPAEAVWSHNASQALSTLASDGEQRNRLRLDKVFRRLLFTKGRKGLRGLIHYPWQALKQRASIWSYEACCGRHPSND